MCLAHKANFKQSPIIVALYNESENKKLNMHQLFNYNKGHYKNIPTSSLHRIQESFLLLSNFK